MTRPNYSGLSWRGTVLAWIANRIFPNQWRDDLAYWLHDKAGRWAR